MPYASPQQRSAAWAQRDEKAWDETVTGGNELTKREVYDYYNDPITQQRILATLANRDLVAVQARSPEKQIYRRYEKPGMPLRVTSVRDLARLTKQRFADFSPTIGSKTDEVWVDIDAGASTDIDSLKPVVRKVESVMKKLPGVLDSEITFSGGTGFHVRGHLDKEQNTTRMRELLKKHLRPLVRENKILTLSPPKSDEIRLDVSTLHDKGSIRAPYSINAQTGLVAVPLTRKQLRDFDPQVDALPSVVKGQEFAPGIPSERAVQELPEAKDKKWTLAIQEHAAERAGKHWDLRLVDPTTTYAHSWAVPKAQLPNPGAKPLLAVHMPTHTARYALGFGGKKPEEISEGYGKGIVEIKHKEPVKVLSSSPDKVKFERTVNGKPEQYMLFRTKDKNWLLRNITKNEESSMKTAKEIGFTDALKKLGVARNDIMTSPSRTETQQPLDFGDTQLPAGTLASMMAQLDTRMIDKKRKPNQSEKIDDRLNRETTWSSPADIPSDYMVGATTGISGAF